MTPELASNSACNPSDIAFAYAILPPKGDPEQEGLFPLGEISLVAGPSGAGKSTWLLQVIRSYKLGEEFFGRPVCPKKFMFLSYDRSENGMKRTGRRMRINLADVNFYEPTNQEAGHALTTMLTDLLKRPEFSGTEVFFVEGLDMKVPNGKMNDAAEVLEFLTKLQQFAADHHIAIIGTVGSPKMKPKDRYENPRERVSGPGMWSRKVETIIVVEPTQNENIREVHICPRQSREEKHCFMWQHGRLVETSCAGGTGQSAPTKTVEERIEAWAEAKRAQLRPGEPLLFTIQILQMALGLTDRTQKSSVQHAINRLIERGKAVKEKHGTYRWISEPKEASEAGDSGSTAAASGKTSNVVMLPVEVQDGADPDAIFAPTFPPESPDDNGDGGAA